MVAHLVVAAVRECSRDSALAKSFSSATERNWIKWNDGNIGWKQANYVAAYGANLWGSKCEGNYEYQRKRNNVFQFHASSATSEEIQ